jgi:hypothetical protein
MLRRNARLVWLAICGHEEQMDLLENNRFYTLAFSW